MKIIQINHIKTEVIATYFAAFAVFFMQTTLEVN